MAMCINKPEAGDVISFNFIAGDVKVLGTVVDLLSKQFTIRVIEPEKFFEKIFYVFYDDDWIHDFDPAVRLTI